MIDLESILTDEELDELEGVEVSAPSKPVLSGAPLQATVEEAERFVKEILIDFPGLVARTSHYLLSLIDIARKVKYAAPTRLCYNQREIGSGATLLALMTSHLSPQLLDDLRIAVCKYAETNPITTPITGAEPEIIDGDPLAYQAVEAIPEEKCASSTKEGWASW